MTMSGAARYRNRNRGGSELPQDPQEERPELDPIPEQPEDRTGETPAESTRDKSDEMQETFIARYARLKALILKKR